MKKFILGVILAITLASCHSSKEAVVEAPKPNRGNTYPQLYVEKPASIVVMPPIDNSNKVDLKDYFYNTLYTPLCEKGYYVFAPELTLDIFKNESAYNSELFINTNCNAFKKVLGADAALFTVIRKCKKNSLNGTVEIVVEYILKSTSTGTVLFHRIGNVWYSVDVEVGKQNSWSGALLSYAASAAVTSIKDPTALCRKCNKVVLEDLPLGKYHEGYLKDNEVLVGDSIVSVRVKE